MSGFAIQHLAGALTSTTFRGITPANDWMAVQILNTSNVVVYLRTDPGDPSTEYPIPKDGQYTVQAPFTPGDTAWRFKASSPAFYLKTKSGNGDGVYISWS